MRKKADLALFKKRPLGKKPKKSFGRKLKKRR